MNKHKTRSMDCYISRSNSSSILHKITMVHVGADYSVSCNCIAIVRGV